MRNGEQSLRSLFALELYGLVLGLDDAGLKGCIRDLVVLNRLIIKDLRLGKVFLGLGRIVLFYVRGAQVVRHVHDLFIGTVRFQKDVKTHVQISLIAGLDQSPSIGIRHQRLERVGVLHQLVSLSAVLQRVGVADGLVARKIVINLVVVGPELQQLQIQVAGLVLVRIRRLHVNRAAKRKGRLMYF